MKTLIIIDAQNDFMPGGSLEVPDGDEIVPVINSIQGKFDLVIASQDWHPQNHVSFASNHEERVVFDEIEIHGKSQTLWPDHCIQGSKGAEFHKDLNIEKWNKIFQKGTNPLIDSYSAFYDNGHLKSTGLADYLNEKGASELYMCGLAADICVYYSLMDAVKEGFTCYFIEDASKPLDKENFGRLKDEMKAKGITILNSSEIL